KKIYNRFFAFLFGWSNFTAIRSASAASIAYVFSMSFNSLVPLPQLPDSIASLSFFGLFTPFDNFGVKALTIGLVLLLSYVNYIGLKFGEGLNRNVTIVVILSIFLVILLGLTMGGGTIENFQTPSVNYVEKSWWSGAFIQ